MFTGTSYQSEVGRIVQELISKGYENISISRNEISNQWIISWK